MEGIKISDARRIDVHDELLIPVADNTIYDATVIQLGDLKEYIQLQIVDAIRDIAKEESTTSVNQANNWILYK